MTRRAFGLGTLLLLVTAAAPCRADLKPEVIERGTKATALVLISSPTGWTGCAFCIGKAGLFLTNAHVVEKATAGGSAIELLINSGLANQRVLRAKVVRHDDRLDLALLEIDRSVKPQDLKDAGTAVRALAQAAQEPELTPLELGKDANLVELAEVAAFGSPFRPNPPANINAYPAVNESLAHITALRRDSGQLLGVQFDTQLNPGNAGGPVLDAVGKVIGVVAATVQGAAMNLAIPVGRISEFLQAPGLTFDPPPLTDEDRTRPVTWTIQLMPPTPQGKLPEGVSVAVTVQAGTGEPRVLKAEPADAGAFKLTLTPLPSEPERRVELQVRFSAPPLNFRMLSVDKEIQVGRMKFKLSELRQIFGGASSRVETTGRKTIGGPIEGLGTARVTIGREVETAELNQAQMINIRAIEVPVRRVVALVEASQGSKVVATIRKQPEFRTTAPSAARATPNAAKAAARPSPGGARPAGDDDGLTKLGAALDVDGVPRGAGQEIKRPRIEIPPARLTPGPAGASEDLMVRQTAGPISDVTVGGGAAICC